MMSKNIDWKCWIEGAVELVSFTLLLASCFMLLVFMHIYVNG